MNIVLCTHYLCCPQKRDCPHAMQHELTQHCVGDSHRCQIDSRCQDPVSRSGWKRKLNNQK